MDKIETRQDAQIEIEKILLFNLSRPSVTGLFDFKTFSAFSVYKFFNLKICKVNV